MTEATAPSPTRYGKGYKPDTHDHRLRQRGSRHLLGASPTYPVSASLEQYEAPIMDQGQTGSCTGHGSSQGIYCAHEAAGKPLGFVPSPDSIYKPTRCIERAAFYPPGVPLPALTDEGAMPADVMTACSTIGVRPIAAPTPDGRYSDVWGPDDGPAPPNVNVEPQLGEFEAGAKQIVLGEYRIDEKATDFVAQTCAAISQGMPVGIGVFVDSTFEAWGEGWTPDRQPVSTVNLNDKTGGGHWLCITSYRIVNGEVIFRGPNSWSKSWGDQGHFEVTDAWLRKACSDAYVWKIAA